MLAIGDSVRTDLAGAHGFGIDCLFVTRGIHAEEFEGIDQLDPASVKELFGHPPRALTRELQVVAEGFSVMPAKAGSSTPRPCAARWRCRWNTDRPAQPGDDNDGRRSAGYALAISGNTASILVFSVAALNGLTM